MKRTYIHVGDRVILTHGSKYIPAGTRGISVGKYGNGHKIVFDYIKVAEEIGMKYQPVKVERRCLDLVKCNLDYGNRTKNPSK